MLDARHLRQGALHERVDFRFRTTERLFDEEPAIEDGPAAIGDARRLNAVDRLPALDAR